MTTAARLIGGAGTGKTTELLRVLENVLSRGLSVWEVGFVSFTRAARREASNRAAELTGVQADDLERGGHFRTLHSICYHALQQSSDLLLTDNKKSREWLEEALGAPVGEALANPLIDDDGSAAFDVTTNVGMAVKIWDMARSRLEPLSVAWDRMYRTGVQAMPSYEETVAVAEQYEQAKRLDDRSDFIDLMGRFAGWSFGVDGHERTEPQGHSPALRAWIHDECQDTSRLAMSVFERLIEGSDWVYLAGDPFQSIYQFAGADPAIFLGFPVAKERIMPQSYRCAPAILDLGENILRAASDYWDRGIAPAEHDGEVEYSRYSNQFLEDLLRPDENTTWLLLARTNYHASRLTRRLDEASIPWATTKGRGGWGHSSKQEALALLCAFEFFTKQDHPFGVSAAEWRKVVAALPAGKTDTLLLERGTKAIWDDATRRPDKEERRDWGQLGEWGASPKFFAAVRSGDWVNAIAGARQFTRAVATWGMEATKSPTIRVGTIHSVKGAEADNVLWLTTGTQAITTACNDREQADTEARVAYVAATRARRRLIVAVEPNKRHRYRGPW